MISYVTAIIELAKVDASVAITMAAHIRVYAITKVWIKETKEKFLPN